MTQTTRREARTQLVLTLAAIVVGGVVFAVTADFVIGVGVGAAFFALVRQAMTVWRRKDQEQAQDPRDAHRENVHQ